MDRRLSKIPQTSLRDQAVSAIRDAIIQGHFKSGEKIPEQELAEQLGVSRTPIREAIRILELQGLVETRPKNGTYIAHLDREQTRDSLLVRVALEEFAVRQALERLDPPAWDEVCAKLQRLLDGMGDAARRDDPIAVMELDVEWHTLLIDAARNSYLSRVWRIVGLPFLIWSPERELYPLALEEWGVVFDTRHRQLLEALRGRDPERCGEAIRTHIVRTKMLDIDASLEGR